MIETAVGVTFEAMEGLTNAHLGAYWTELGGEWPHTQDSRPVERQIEQFADPWFNTQRRLKLSQNPSSRLVAFNLDRSRAIQAQQSGFDFSWIRVAGNPYPRYGPVREEFDSAWGHFLTFLHGREFAEPVLQQWEITYVNKIAEGTLWDSPDDWPGIFSTSFGIPWKSSLANLESFSTHWHFQIPDRRGRLHVHVTHGKHEGDNALMMVLTARGPIEEQKDWGLSDGLDLGRRAIVTYFKEITSTSAHQTWKIES